MSTTTIENPPHNHKENTVITSHNFSFMTDEEIVQLAKNHHLEATEHLLVRYRSMVENKSKTFFMLGADREDLIQEGMIGLCRAIRDYKQDKMDCFKPFAELCIHRQMITAIKTAARQKHAPLNKALSLDQTINVEGNESPLLETLPDTSYTPGNHELDSQQSTQQMIEQIKNTLSDLEQETINEYLAGKTYTEISQKLNCSAKAIDNALQRAKKKLSALVHNQNLH